MEKWLSFGSFALAGLLHIGFFVFESILFQNPKMAKRLRMSEHEHRAVKLWAYNQGFYNLALGLGTFVGLYFVLKFQVIIAGTILSFCGFTMVMAGVVLWFSAPDWRKSALVQAIPPLLGFLFLYFHISRFL